uniref:Uncharacterized protein n=1 Tax=Seriola lalandi dorsalis TaxID=1841481 RepID=A0A3B4XHD0_SERLL
IICQKTTPERKVCVCVCMLDSAVPFLNQNLIYGRPHTRTHCISWSQEKDYCAFQQEKKNAYLTHNHRITGIIHSPNVQRCERKTVIFLR